MTKINQQLFAMLLIAANFQAFGQTQSVVSVVQPDRFIAITTGATPDIYIDGPLTKESVSQLTSAVEKWKISEATVHLNSPGGSLLAGIELGRVIRRYGFHTQVGRKPPNGGIDIAGGCYSACVFAYVGGVYRYMVGESQIGVHRFSTAAPAASDLDMAQVLSAAITNHLTAMGVDVALFERMVQAPSDGIIVLSKVERKNLRVVNEGVLPPAWALVNTQGNIYLKGEQQTFRGLGKILFNCVNGELVGAAFYEGGSNAEQIGATQRYSLRVDDQFLPIASVMGPARVVNGYVSVYFPLGTDQLEAILPSRSIGFAFHPPNQDLFYGFTVGMDDAGAKILDFIKYCSTQKK